MTQKNISCTTNATEKGPKLVSTILDLEKHQKIFDLVVLKRVKVVLRMQITEKEHIDYW